MHFKKEWFNSRSIWGMLSDYLGRLKVISKINRGSVYQLENIDKCLCGSKKFNWISNKDRYRIRVKFSQCNECGLIIQSLRLTAESLKRFYYRDYRILYRSSTHIDEAYFARSRRRGQRIIKYLTETGISLSGKIVIEIGSGCGGILKEFQSLQNEVAGCDYDRACVDFSVQKNIPSVCGGISVFLQQNRKADIVILSHLLEHISDPVSFLSALRSILKGNGIVYVEVPGIPRGKALLSIEKEFQIAHLWYFNLDNLSALFMENGFDIIAGDDEVRAVFKKRPHGPKIEL